MNWLIDLVIRSKDAVAAKVAEWMDAGEPVTDPKAEEAAKRADEAMTRLERYTAQGRARSQK